MFCIGWRLCISDAYVFVYCCFKLIRLVCFCILLIMSFRPNQCEKNPINTPMFNIYRYYLKLCKMWHNVLGQSCFFFSRGPLGPTAHIKLGAPTKIRCRWRRTCTNNLCGTFCPPPREFRALLYDPQKMFKVKVMPH